MLRNPNILLLQIAKCTVLLPQPDSHIDEVWKFMHYAEIVEVQRLLRGLESSTQG
jgi:hypothetical protein